MVAIVNKVYQVNNKLIWKTKVWQNVLFQKISIFAPWKVIPISERVGISKSKIFKAKYLTGILEGRASNQKSFQGNGYFLE